MEAIILAAGAGRRLGPLTTHRPKCLLPVGSDVTLLDVMLQILEEVGVKAVTVVGGHCYQALEAHLKARWSKRAVLPHLIYNSRFRTTNNIVSLDCISDGFVVRDEVLLLNSDVLCPATVIMKLIGEDGSVLAVDDSKPLGQEEMKVLVGRDMYITRISKTLDSSESQGEYIGAAKFDPDTFSVFLSRIRAFVSHGKTDLYYEDVLDDAIVSGDLRVRAMPIGELAWTEIDTPEDLQYARAIYQRFWKNG